MAKKENERSEKQGKEERRQKHKKTLRALIAILTTVLIAIVAFYVAPEVRKHTNADTSEDESVITTDKEIVGAMALSNGNIVVTTDSVVSFKTNSKVRYTEKIGYSKPVFKSSEKKYIVFERASGKYTVGDKSKVIYQDDLDTEIINADISNNGNYALVLKSSQSLARLSVRSSKNEEFFAWECSEDYIIDVAISKNGKYAAVAAMNVVDGDIRSTVYYFDLTTLSVKSKIEYPNETVYKIKFINNEKISVISDISYMIADMSQRRSEVVSYDYDSISGYTFGSKSSVAISKNDFGSLNEKSIMVIDKNCEKLFETVVESEILDFQTDSKKLYVLTAGSVLVYGVSSGELMSTIEVDDTVSKISLVGKSLLGYTVDAVYLYEVK